MRALDASEQCGLPNVHGEPYLVNTKPHLTYEEFLLLQDIGDGNDEQNTAKEEQLHRLLSLQYIRSVGGSYFLTPYGERRIRSGS